MQRKLRSSKQTVLLLVRLEQIVFGAITQEQTATDKQTNRHNYITTSGVKMVLIQLKSSRVDATKQSNTNRDYDNLYVILTREMLAGAWHSREPSAVAVWHDRLFLFQGTFCSGDLHIKRIYLTSNEKDGHPFLTRLAPNAIQSVVQWHSAQ